MPGAPFCSAALIVCGADSGRQVSAELRIQARAPTLWVGPENVSLKLSRTDPRALLRSQKQRTLGLARSESVLMP